MLLKTPEVAAIQRRTGSELGLFATPSEHRRRARPPQAARPARAARPRRSSPIFATSCTKRRPASRSSSCSCSRTCSAISKAIPTPIEVKVFGDDANVLAELGGQMEEMLGKVEGVVDIVGVQSGNPEMTWQIDPTAAGRLGLTVADVSAADLRRRGWARSRPTTWRSIASIPVRVRYPDAIRFDGGRLGQTMVRGTEGRTAPISALATVGAGDRADGADAREPAADGARERTARRTRSRRRGRPRSPRSCGT